jgi:hypothetical protein
MIVFAWFVILIFVATASGAPDTKAVKPACNAQTKGKIWPENTSRGNGVPIEICATRFWRFRWEQLTVDVSQLKAGHKLAIAAAAVTPAADRTLARDVAAPRE